MFGIPGWAFGVGVIFLFIAAYQIVVARFVPPGYRRRQWKTDQPALPEDLEARLGELDQLKQRVGELEERVDFAERLLAQQREGQRLGPPQG